MKGYIFPTMLVRKYLIRNPINIFFSLQICESTASSCARFKGNDIISAQDIGSNSERGTVRYSTSTSGIARSSTTASAKGSHIGINRGRVSF